MNELNVRSSKDDKGWGIEGIISLQESLQCVNFSAT